MKPGATPRCEAIAVGGSAGALGILTDLVQALPGEFQVPILVCLHLHPSDEGNLSRLLDDRSALAAVDVHDKMPVLAGRIHVAPANYHLLVERSRTLALSIDPKVNHSRPSIDVLLESAARAFGAGLLAILLSGANEDGTVGVGIVRGRGGLTVVQDPATATVAVMPRAAIDSGAATMILPPADIRRLVLRLHDDPALVPTIGKASHD